MSLRLSRSVSQADQARGVRASAADLTKAIVALLLKFLFIPCFHLEIGVFRNTPRRLGQILGSCDRTRFIDHLPRYVDCLGNDGIAAEIVPVLLVMRLESG